jgi:hypothetical protein
LPNSSSRLRCQLTGDNSGIRKERDTNLKQRVGLVFSEEEEPTTRSEHRHREEENPEKPLNFEEFQ